jgi:hypothetical protein
MICGVGIDVRQLSLYVQSSFKGNGRVGIFQRFPAIIRISGRVGKHAFLRDAWIAVMRSLNAPGAAPEHH